MIRLLQRGRAAEAAIGCLESPHFIEPSHASFRESAFDVKQASIGGRGRPVAGDPITSDTIGGNSLRTLFQRHTARRLGFFGNGLAAFRTDAGYVASEVVRTIHAQPMLPTPPSAGRTADQVEG